MIIAFKEVIVIAGGGHGELLHGAVILVRVKGHGARGSEIHVGRKTA